MGEIMGEIKVTFGALEAARADVVGTAARTRFLGPGACRHAPLVARSPHIDGQGYPSPAGDFKSPPWRLTPHHGPAGRGTHRDRHRFALAVSAAR